MAWKESCFWGERLVAFLSITPDKLPLNQRIGMSPVSLGFCGMEVCKEEVGGEGTCLQDFFGVRVFG